MSLNEHLIRLSEYKIGFNIYEGTIIISVVYPKGWTVIEPENSPIQLQKDDGRYYYWIGIETDVETIFELIDETIAYNKDIEAKAELFKEKIAELQQVFVTEDFETLKTLEFKVKKKQPKKQVSKKQEKQAEKEKIETKTENVTEDKKEEEQKPMSEEPTTVENSEVENNQNDFEETKLVSLEETKSKVEEPTEIDKKIEQAIKNKKKR